MAERYPIPADELDAYFEEVAEPKGWTRAAFEGLLWSLRKNSAGSMWRKIKAEVETSR